MEAPSLPPAAPLDLTKASPALTYAAIDSRLQEYKQLYKVCTLVEPPNSFTFHEQFLCLIVNVTVYPDVDMTPVREMLELYALLLFLHRETTSDALLEDRRLRLDVCARDEVSPYIHVRIDWPKFTVNGERIKNVDTTECARALWKSAIELFEYDTPQPKLSDFYYETRRQILELYNVDEAFVAKAEARVRLSFNWSPPLADVMATMPIATLRRLELIVPSTPLPPENGSRTRLRFHEVGTSMDLKQFEYEDVSSSIKSWVLPGSEVTYINLKVSCAWTSDDALAFVALLNQGRVEYLELSVETTQAFELAMDVCAQVETVTNVTIVVKIAKDWNAGESPIYGTTYKTRDSSTGPRALLINVTEMPAMTDFTSVMLGLLDGDGPSTRTAIDECGELQLRTRVNEPSAKDMGELLPLLERVGKKVKLLHTDSYGSSEAFTDDIYANEPDAFAIRPVILACPNLRVLNMQGAIFEDLAEMYEKGLANMQTLQVQWAPEASILALAKAWSDRESKIAHKLVEFSTRSASDAVVGALVSALEHNKKIRYVRTGRRPQGDEAALALTAHHQRVLAPGGSAFGKLLDAMASEGSESAALARDCVDDDVLETIADFVGPTMYRQIHMR